MTPHKRRIVELAFSGMPLPLIARTLRVEHSTIKNHLSQCYAIYGVHTLMQLRNVIEACELKKKAAHS